MLLRGFDSENNFNTVSISSKTKGTLVAAVSSFISVSSVFCMRKACSVLKSS